DRLVAQVGSDAYGAVSVKINYWATSKIVGAVSASVFFPQPRVESALVDIRRRSEPGVTDVEASELFALVRTGFAKRRKMLRRALADVALTADFESASVNPESRAEELDLAAWGRLCKIIKSRLAGSHQ
ncbi:MAG: rRNA ((1518)-N(6)/adenine(1519)-N(6))-dimethyltransferase RsmA, partial [Actinomycetota bacterium]